MISFSSKVKKELSELSNLANKDLVKSELEGYLLTSSSNKFITENQYNINRFSKLLNNVGQNNYTIEMKGNNFCIKTKEKIKVEENIKDENCAKALVRGAFMGAGSITNPKNVYHLEIVFQREDSANVINQILQEYGISSKVIKRDKSYVVYMKDGENISKLLAFIGANKSVLEFEDTRVMKEIKNNVNRIVNCETANLNKTILSSVRQIEDIKLIKSKHKFDRLSSKEKELANLRLDNPDATLLELGKMLEVPISKSGVNHRMEAISRLAEELRGK